MSRSGTRYSGSGIGSLARWLPFISLLAICGVPESAHSGYDCSRYYHLLPGVTDLEVVDGGIELLLVGREPDLACTRVRHDDESATWVEAGKASCTPLGQPTRCGSDLPGLGLSTRRILELRPEFREILESRTAATGTELDLDYDGGTSTGACITERGYVWFGLSFYSGEGELGVGLWLAARRRDQPCRKAEAGISGVEQRAERPIVDVESVAPAGIDANDDRFRLSHQRPARLA